MKNKIIGILGLSILIIVIISVSVWSYSNSTSDLKHFDNGIVAFDYPSNMEIVDESTSTGMLLYVNYDSVTLCIIKSPYKPFDSSNKPKTLEKSIDDVDIVNLVKTSISGKDAINVTAKFNDGTRYYFTVIDMNETNLIEISQTQFITNNPDITAYKTYQVVVNSFQIK